MSAGIVCRKRSNLFDLNLPKRIRSVNNNNNNLSYCCSISSSPLDHLLLLFPHMDKQLIERALEDCGDDLDSAIKSLNDLRLGSDENLRPVAGNSGATQESSSQFFTQANCETTPTEELSAVKEVHTEKTEWVELFVREMMSASNIDDAKSRASQALEVLEKSICARAAKATACSFQQENLMLKQQFEALVHENAILKRAVAIQHERQKEFEDRGQELNQLKQLVSQYQEQVRTLEVNNYALSMHLKQAQQGNSLPGRFHPDVF